MYFQAAIKSRPVNLSSVKGDGSDDKNPREVERETEIMESTAYFFFELLKETDP